MQMYSVLYDSQSDPFGLTTTKPICVKYPQDIPNDAKGYLLLHGGEDISPGIYKQKPNRFCNAIPEASRRDQIEINMITRAKELGLTILGICRGAQLLCALDGGTLVQHIVGHTSTNHNIIDNYGDNIGKSNTAHHQMMVPRDSRTTEVLGRVNQPILGYSEEDTLREYQNVPEIVVFRNYKALGVQFHPEWMTTTDHIVTWCRNYILNNLVKG